MEKHKFILVGQEVGASGLPVTKELFTYEGDALGLEHGFVTVLDFEAPGQTVAVIRLGEGQSIKRA